MKAKLLLALGAGVVTGAAQAQAPAPAAKAPAVPPIEVRLSGQINRAVMHVDDGAEKEWFNVDNGNSSTRFRFNAEGQIVETWNLTDSLAIMQQLGLIPTQPK